MKKFTLALKQLLFVCLFVSALVSCKKDNDDDNNPQNCLITKITMPGVTVKLTYDGQNRVIRAQDDVSGEILANYSYPANKMLIESGTPGTTDYYKVEYTYNTAGNIVRMVEVYDLDTYQTDYTWNGNVLVSSIDDLGTVTDYTWSNGNLISEMSMYGTVAYQYNNKPAAQGDINWFYTVSGESLPLRLANSVIRETYTYPPSGAEEYNYSYTYDADGKITSMNADGDVISYQYTCQ